MDTFFRYMVAWVAILNPCPFAPLKGFRLLNILLSILENVSCKAGTFHCGSGECIPLSLQCDFNDDCFDGTDELTCGKKLCYIICVLFQRSLQLYARSYIERDWKNIDELLKGSGTQR